MLTHEEAKTLYEKMRAMEKMAKDIRLQLDTDSYKCSHTPIYKFTVHVKPPILDSHWDLPTEHLTITGICINEGEFEEHLNCFGSLPGGRDKTIHSVTYFRVDGILTHTGGGHCILTVPQHCSDEEWEELKKGNFGKFKHPTWYKCA